MPSLAFPLLPTLLLFVGLVNGAKAIAEPVIVTALAEKYVVASMPTPERAAVFEKYALHFFRGFQSPTYAPESPKPGIETAAFADGQAYWRDYPTQRGEIFLGFGYVPIVSEGTWLRGFEWSRFSPDGLRTDTWWLSTENVASSNVPPRKGTYTWLTTRVRVTGYLSQPGHYGHMSAWRRELIAQSIELIGVEEPDAKEKVRD
jgi:hypothetical protein